MLTIETIIGPSKINGMGLFTVFDIKKGRKVWEWRHGFIDQEIWPEVYKEMNKRDKNYVRKHAYLEKENNCWYLCGDNTRFMNHSFSPNLITQNEADYALRDIKSGEELTIDYSTFDLDWKRKLKNA